MSKNLTPVDISDYQDAHYNLTEDEAFRVIYGTPARFAERYMAERERRMNYLAMLRNWAYGVEINILPPALAREETPDTTA